MRALVVGEEARDRAAVATDRVLDGERRLARVRGRVRANPTRTPPLPLPRAREACCAISRLITSHGFGPRPSTWVDGRVGWEAAWGGRPRGTRASVARLAIAW